METPELTGNTRWRLRCREKERTNHKGGSIRPCLYSLFIIIIITTEYYYYYYYYYITYYIIYYLLPSPSLGYPDRPPHAIYEMRPSFRLFVLFLALFAFFFFSFLLFCLFAFFGLVSGTGSL